MTQIDFTPRTMQLGTNGGSATITIEVGAPGANGGSDASYAGYVADPSSATAAALSATYAPRDLGLIAYAENRTGQGTTGPAGSAAAVLGCVIGVPPTDRDVWIEWGAMLGVSTPGQGYLGLTIYEITSGAAANGDARISRCYTNEVVTTTKDTKEGRCYVGPSASLRTFMLTISTAQEGSSLSGYAVNAQTINGRSWIAAVAR